jgi:hypothetical protein
LYLAALKDEEADTWQLPWWYFDLLDAEDAHCPPWELYDQWTPKRFWRECLKHLRYARNAVKEKESQTDT